MELWPPHNCRSVFHICRIYMYIEPICSDILICQESVCKIWIKTNGNCVSYTLGGVDVIMSKWNTPKIWTKFYECAQNRRCTSSMCKQSLCTIWILSNENCWELQITQPRHPLTFRMKKNLSSTPLKNDEIFIKCAQNKRCTPTIYSQPICKVLIYLNENCWGYRWYKPGLEVIKLTYSLRLRIKRNDWLLADTCPQAEIIALYSESEKELKFYNLKARHP